MKASAAIAVAVLLAAAIAFPLAGSSYYTELAAKIMVFAIFAMSLNLLIGVTGLVSFGHAAFFGIAAYAVALLTPKNEAASLWLVLPASVLAAAAAAFVIGLFVLRTRGIYFIMVTLAFAQMAYFVFHDTPLGGGSDGVFLSVRPVVQIGPWQLLDLADGRQLYYLVLLLLAATYGFLARLLRSPFGRVLAGIRSNEQRMRSLGYSTYWYKLGAFTLAGALAGVAGCLFAVLFGFVNPELLAWHHSGDAILMVLLGGMGSLAGGIVGSLAFVLMQETFADLTKHWQLAMGVVIVLIVLFLPGGLTAAPGRLQRALLRERSGDTRG